MKMGGQIVPYTTCSASHSVIGENMNIILLCLYRKFLNDFAPALCWFIINGSQISDNTASKNLDHLGFPVHPVFQGCSQEQGFIQYNQFSCITGGLILGRFARKAQFRPRGPSAPLTGFVLNKQIKWSERISGLANKGPRETVLEATGMCQASTSAGQWCDWRMRDVWVEPLKGRFQSDGLSLSP